MRRLIGLLMIFVLVFPLLIGVVTVVAVREIGSSLQAEIDRSGDRIETKLHTVETTLNTASERLEVLKSVADQISSATTSTAQDVVEAINSFEIRYSGFQWPAAVQSVLAIIGLRLPDIPPVDITIPGMSAVRDFLQNLYDTIASLARALADVALLAEVPAQLGEVAGEVQTLYDNLLAIIAPYLGTIQFVVVGLIVWFAALYVVLVYTWLARAWALLLGRPVVVV